MAVAGSKMAADMGGGATASDLAKKRLEVTPAPIAKLKTNSKNEARFGKRKKPTNVTYDRPEQLIPPGDPITPDALKAARREWNRRNQTTGTRRGGASA